jgi:class 3 adenylate cyclase
LDEVERWLAPLGLAQLAPVFRAHDVDLEILPELSEADLEKLGLSLGQRKKLLKAAASLSHQSLATARSAKSTPSLSAVSAAERRQLSVMFCDLVGSTALAKRLDPEDLREIIGAYQKRVARIVARYDGFVAKYMGDGVLVYFGYPQAHEDDAERAVRAGLKLADTIHRIRLQADVEPLQVRIGIATGVVVVGDLVGSGEAQERGVVGETPNLAARLQALAEPNAVVVAASTYHLIGGLFEYEDLGALEVKGYAEPVRVWRVRGQSAAESRYEALHPATAVTPLVGREEEVELLLRRWQRAKSGDGQVVLLSGEPGIGKSRLIAALQEQIEGEPQTRLRYFCSPYYQDSTLHPILEQLERAAGFRRDDAPAIRLEKLESLLSQTSPLDQDVALLAELLSLPVTDRYPPHDFTPQRKKEKTFKVLLRQLEALAQRRPVLMIFEDVHWIDPTSHELLDLIIERIRRLPVLLLATFRPEFPPPWTGRPHVTTVMLNRLDHRDGAALVRRIAGSKSTLPGDIVDEIVERADGVPLFVEELTKAVLEADAQDKDAIGALAAVPLPALAIPATLHALLMARLDRLGPAAKEIAQIGAAVGREFSYELLAAITPRSAMELQNALDPLVGAGLLFQRGTPPQAAYAFKHALVQDAAYGTLLRGKRKELHARIAAVLEAQFPDTVETQPELLARHITEAGLVGPAIGYWRQAGTRARRRSADVEAARHFRRALGLAESLPDTRERDELELDLCIELGGALVATSGYGVDECRDLFARARALCDRLGGATPKLFPVLYGHWVYEHVNGRLTISIGLAEQFLDQAECTANRALEMIGHRLVGFTLLARGRADLALPHLRCALAAYDPSRDAPLGYVYGQNPKVGALMGTGVALGHLGFPDEAARMVRLGMDEARMLAHSNTLAWALFHASLFHVLRRDLVAAEGLAGELIAIAQEQGALFWTTRGCAILSCARAGQNASTDNLAQLHRDIEAMHAEPSWRVFTPCITVVAAEILCTSGDVHGGLRLLEEVHPLVEQGEQRLAEAESYRVRADLSLAGAAGEAEADLFRALDVARGQSAKTFELRAATSLARLWRHDKCRQAHDLLAPVYDWFTEGFDTPDLRSAKALLDELGD